MSWSATKRQQFLNERQKAVDSFYNNKNLVEDSIESAYKFENAGSMSNITRGKAAISTAVETVSKKIVELNDIVNKLKAAMEADKNDIAATKEAVATIQAELEKERTLNEIRKEQAESLAKKGAGNYHSTWMGLYRPLKEESRTGLAVAAVAFFLIFIALVVFGFTNSSAIGVNIGSIGSIATKTNGIPDLFSGFTQQKNRLFK
jgi:multidrug efflux pump subunit AcrB